jgi:hypothetical protein
MRFNLFFAICVAGVSMSCIAKAQELENFVFPGLGYSILVPESANVTRRYGTPEDVALFEITLDAGTVGHFAFDFAPGHDALVDDFDDLDRVRDDAEVFFLLSGEDYLFAGEAFCARRRDDPSQAECVVLTDAAFRMMLELPEFEDSDDWPYVHVQFESDHYDTFVGIVRSFQRVPQVLEVER